MLPDLLKPLADPCRPWLVAILLSAEFTVQELTLPAMSGRRTGK